MKNIAHNPENISPAVGGYSHGVEFSKDARCLYISGQIPEAGGEVPSGFEEQCEAVWENVREILRSAEMGVEDLVKVTTFLTDPKHAESNSRIRQRYLGGAKPALTVVVVRTLDPVWLLEFEAIAASGG